MAAPPSIKGSVFASVVEEVNKATAEASLSEADLARWLEPSDRALLDANIQVSSWYDIRAYTRMNELLRDVEGHGDNDFLVARGRETAARLLEAGFYAQMEYLNRIDLSRATEDEERVASFGRDLRKLTTLSASILNFSSWKSQRDPDHALRYMIEVSDARDFPEVLCWRSEGFINRMAAQHSRDDLWCWERMERDRIHFKMLRDL